MIFMEIVDSYFIYPVFTGLLLTTVTVAFAMTGDDYWQRTTIDIPKQWHGLFSNPAFFDMMLISYNNDDWIAVKYYLSRIESWSLKFYTCTPRTEQRGMTGCCARRRSPWQAAQRKVGLGSDLGRVLPSRWEAVLECNHGEVTTPINLKAVIDSSISHSLCQWQRVARCMTDDRQRMHQTDRCP